LAIVTATPLAFRARANLVGKVACSGSPKPAVSESPSTTIFTGWPAAAPKPGAKTQAIVISTAARRWTRA